MAKKQHLDDFLREKLDQLPNAPVGGFEKVESKMAVKNHRGILVLMLIPLILSGLYWMSTLTENDLYPGEHPVKHKTIQIEPDVVLESNTNQAPAIEGEPRTNLESAPALVEQNEPQQVAKTTPETQPEPVFVASNTQQDVTNQTDLEPIAEPRMAFNPETQYVEVGTKEPAAQLQNTSEANPKMNMIIPAADQPVLDEDLVDAFDDVDVRETSPWSVTLNVYPNYTFREFYIKEGYEDMVNERYEAIINESEKGGFAFNVGLDVRYHIGNNVFIGSGLGYIQMKVNGNYDFEIYGAPVVDNTGAIEQLKAFAKPIHISRGIIQEYSFLQVPLHVSYQPWASKKVRLIIEGGFSFIRFLGADGTTIDYQTLAPKELNTEMFNKNLASLDFKVGATYMVSDAIGIGLEPTLMYFSGSIYPDEHPVHVVPWSVGLNINLRMRLY